MMEIVMFSGSAVLASIMIAIAWYIHSKRNGTTGSPPSVSSPSVTSATTTSSPTTSTTVAPSPTTTTGPTTSGASLTTFGTMTKVSLAKDGKYIGHVFDAKNKQNMCTIKFEQPASKPFVFKKQKDGHYAIFTDCDGDTKFTSRLSDNATDLIQAGRMSTDVWKITCPSSTQGCSFQAKKSKKYLALNGLSATPVYWTVKKN